MKRFKKLLVYLPHTVVDSSVTSWVATIAENSHSEKIDVVSSLEGYEHLMSETEWQKFVEDVSVEWKAQSPLSNVEAEINYQLFRRPGLKILLEKMVTGDYDLVVLPKEHPDGISFIERVVRKSTSGVLVVPDGAQPDLSRIMLAVDFADISQLAIDWAEAFATLADGETDLKALHVMQMPNRSRALALINQQELRERIEKISKDKLDDFIQNNAKNAEKWEQIVSEHPLAFAQILEESRNHKTTLLIAGSHGRNAISTALLGGQSIELIRGADCPLLMVKRKNESLGFIKELLGMS